jgi:hypothetical protein
MRYIAVAFTEAEARALIQAAGNTMDSGDWDEWAKSASGKRLVDAGWRAYEKLQKATHGHVMVGKPPGKPR